MPRLSVIIVGFGLEDPATQSLLQGALTSLAAQSWRDFEVLIVDNSIEPGGLDGLDLRGLPEVLCLPHAGNLGFAAGNNRAAERASGEWLALLNPDATADPGWLASMVDAMARHPGASMFASLQVNMDDPQRLDGAGDCFFGLGFPWRGGYGRPAAETPPEGLCFSPCGAGALYRRDAFLAVGGFDEAFFCFGEDTDLAYRLRLQGHHCIFVPVALIHHKGGAVAGRVSDFSVFHGARNRVWGYVKTTPPLLFWATLPGHVVFTLLVLVRGLMTGRMVATWRGIMSALFDLPRILQQRRAIQSSRTVGSRGVAGAMCWNPITLFQRKTDVRAFRKA